MGFHLTSLAEDGHVKEVQVQSEVSDGGKYVLLEIVPFQTERLVWIHPATNLISLITH